MINEYSCIANDNSHHVKTILLNTNPVFIFWSPMDLKNGRTTEKEKWRVTQWQWILKKLIHQNMQKNQKLKKGMFLKVSRFVHRITLNELIVASNILRTINVIQYLCLRVPPKLHVKFFVLPSYFLRKGHVMWFWPITDSIVHGIVRCCHEYLPYDGQLPIRSRNFN